LFISHRMDEVEEISDRVTVLRSGRTVSSVERAKMSVTRLIQNMTGQHGGTPERGAFSRRPGDLVLKAKDVHLDAGAKPINFELRAGEIVGLCGLEGHGQDRFIKRLIDIDEGDGRVVRIDSAGHASAVEWRRSAKLGIAYLPRERRGES